MRMADGLSVALAAQQIVATALDEDIHLNLEALTGRIEHIAAKPAEWRSALAYLAAQNWSAGRTSDAARARDAQFALSQIASQIRSFEERHGGTR